MGEILSYGKSKIDAMLSQLRSDSDGKYALKTDIPAPSSGGGFGGVTVATPSLKQESGAGTGKKLWLADFTFTPYLAGQPGPGLIDSPSTAFGGISFEEAGWYQLTTSVFIEFSGNLPDHVRLEHLEYNARDGAIIHDIPCTALDSDTGNGRMAYGAQARVTSYPFYQEAAAVTGNMVNKTFIYWSTDAVADRAFVNLYFAKLG